MIANNKRRFLGFSEDDFGFDPNRYRGRMVITTMHKAKGLEWDRVYLLSVNNYRLPLRDGLRPVHVGEVVHPRAAEPGGRGAGPAEA